MILQDIISKFVWTPYGIQCPDQPTFMLAHKFLREAILDRHLCLCKVIGFEVKSQVLTRSHTGTYIARHKQIAESYPEMMVLLSDKIFLTNSNRDIICNLRSGENTVDNTMFEGPEHEQISLIYRNNEICRVIEQTCQLKLKVIYDCGYRNNQVNSKRIGTDYFPCNTDFFLGDYVRVLPPDFTSNIVQLRFYNGCTQENLKTLLEYYWEAIQAGSLRKEERGWLQNFMQ